MDRLQREGEGQARGLAPMDQGDGEGQARGLGAKGQVKLRLMDLKSI
jgi:hypothetical protein